ncbi:MAG TPA: PAS domain-containing sensor histidine kinase [Gemmataceae bacterium]|nr:PAS domain-containing sensor histidine kinase [Gemmataceae bacterium]
MSHRPASVPTLIAADGDHAVIALDPAGNIVEWTGGAARVFGYTAGEAVGRPWTVLVPGRAADVRSPADGDGRAEVDCWLVRKDGSQFWACGVATRLPDGAGHGVILRDRTSQHAREVAAAARVAALEEAEARQTAFLATLAHELRNKIYPLLNYAHLVQMKSSEADVRDLGSKLDHLVKVLSRDVDELLDVARVRQGKVRLARRPVDLGEVVRAAVDVVSSRVQAAGHALTVTVPAPAPCVAGDSDRLVQVVVNLLANAVKYTPAGGRVWVAVEPDAGEAVLTVADNGMGLAPERVDTVFDLFAQDDRSLAQAEGGLGIGLSLVKELVTLHGGTVRARSDGVGRGSVFEVRLPRAD